MRTKHLLHGIVLCAALTSAACGSPPTADIDAANAVFDQASKSTGNYAQASMKSAQDAKAELDAELAAQDQKYFKSYDRTRELADKLRVASEKASADAVAARERAAAAAVAKTKAEAEAREKLMTTAVRVGGAIRNPVKTKDVSPEYPPIAKSSRVGGTVQVEATVGPDGKVADARVVKSVPLLDQAALDAVKQWEYKPTMVKGVPVPVIINVGITFKP